MYDEFGNAYNDVAEGAAAKPKPGVVLTRRTSPTQQRNERVLACGLMCAASGGCWAPGCARVSALNAARVTADIAHRSRAHGRMAVRVFDAAPVQRRSRRHRARLRRGRRGRSS